jgi:hypothetical protein
VSRKNPSSSLRCPRCGTEHPLEERFCSECGFPLVYAGYENINPEYTRGELVRVAGGRNQAEAELIQNLLLEEGVPSVLRRTAGFDVPDFLAAGPRDVLVPEAGADAARDMLLEAELAPTEARASAGPNPIIVFGTVSLGGALAALVAWLLLQGV